MSEFSIPVAVLSLGAVGVTPSDIVEAYVRLGCSKEVSSFEVVIHNANGNYSPNGPHPILVGATGGLGLCRQPYNPVNSPLISLKVESVKYVDSPTDNYVNVSGRCWGEWLFRRVITKTYENEKGEAIIKDLIGSFTDLSHNRGGVELIESTDTTYTKLVYEDTPMWDIVKYIAETADKAGVIGFDFRVAPDGKFEFFPKNSKTNNVSLTDKIESCEYRKDIARVRNRIKILGEATKSYPIDKDGLTEILDSPYGTWTTDNGFIGVPLPPANGSIAQDSTVARIGISSIKCHIMNMPSGVLDFLFKSGFEVNTNEYSTLFMFCKVEQSYSGQGTIILHDVNGKYCRKHQNFSANNEFKGYQIGVGAANSDEWDIIEAGFDWTQVKRVRVFQNFPLDTETMFYTHGWGDWWLDGMYFGSKRYEASVEDAASASAYGFREYVETDEELWSDNECELRAKSLLAYLKNPIEYITITSSVLDYQTNPILAGDKIYVNLINEGISANYRAESVEYHYDAEKQDLTVTLELGREPPIIADYLYGLRTFTVNVEKLARTKSGSKGRTGFGLSFNSGGGGGYNGVGKLEVTCEVPAPYDWPTLEPYLWGFDQNGHWTPDSKTLPLGESVLRFKDPVTLNWLEMGMAYTTTDPSPILWLSQHLTVKKDFACGGMLTSFQGALFLGSGLTSPNDMPQIVLAHSESDYGFKDTLELWRFGHAGYGKMRLDELQVDKIKKINGDPFTGFLILDQYGYGTLTGLHFGSGWGDIYRTTVGNDNVIALSGLGLILHGYLNAKSISLNPPAGLPALASDSSAVVCTGINADMLDGYHASDFLISVGLLELSNLPAGPSGHVLTGQGPGNWPQYSDPNSLISSISADSITKGGITNSFTLATPGGGSVTLHFTHSKFTGSS